MKQFICIAVLLASSVAVPCATAQGRMGAGFVFGEPTGLAWNYRLDHSHAVSGAIGLSPFDRYRLHADYLWLSNPFSEKRLGLHYGMGAVLGVGRRHYAVVDGQRRYYLPDNAPGFGVRGVAGVSYTIPGSPLDLFLEVAPLVVLSPGSGMGLDLGFGMRIYP